MSNNESEEKIKRELKDLYTDILKVSFIIKEKGDEIKEVKTDLNKLDRQLNMGAESVVVRLELNERELEKLSKKIVRELAEKEKNKAVIESAKINSGAKIKTQLIILWGTIITIMVANLDKLIIYAKTLWEMLNG